MNDFKQTFILKNDIKQVLKNAENKEYGLPFDNIFALLCNVPFKHSSNLRTIMERELLYMVRDKEVESSIPPYNISKDKSHKTRFYKIVEKDVITYNKIEDASNEQLIQILKEFNIEKQGIPNDKGVILVGPYDAEFLRTLLNEAARRLLDKEKRLEETTKKLRDAEKDIKELLRL